MGEQERDQLGEVMTKIFDMAINHTKVTITGQIVKKRNDGMIIIVEVDSGHYVKVDINDGTTDEEVFSVGDIITDLPLQGAYFNYKDAEVIFTFTATP
jgi:hypothetical protein